VTKPVDATGKPATEKRIHGYDYRAWDKFDVVGAFNLLQTLQM